MLNSILFYPCLFQPVRFRISLHQQIHELQLTSGADHNKSNFKCLHGDGYQNTFYMQFFMQQNVVDLL